MDVFEVEIYRHTPDQPFRFQNLQERQTELLERQKPTLLAAELPPTLSLGRRQPLELFQKWNRLDPALDLVQADRGGLETWHGPGQWVIYFVLPIERLAGVNKSAKRAVMNTLEMLLPWVKRYRPGAHIQDDIRLGIWSDSGKLVSIGLRIKKGWIQSGVAINVLPTPQSFLGISPCGLENERPDFLMNSTQAGQNLNSIFDRVPKEIAQILSAFKP